jgi:DNA-binding CsgD family transcriptional regulator
MSAQSRQLLADVTSDPMAPLVIGVSGPAGTGKSSLLDALSEIYRRAGLAVFRRLATPPAEDAVVLVDDAQALDGEEVAGLVRFAARDEARLVVAYRPWGVPPVLAELARTRPEVQLGHLGPAEVTARIAAGLGSTPDPGMVDRILGQTGGLPALVDHHIDALRAEARTGRPTTVHAGLDRVLTELDRLPSLARDMLLALSLGADPGTDGLAELLVTGPDEVTLALERAWSAGLIEDTGRIIGLAAEGVVRTTSAIRRREIQRRIAERQLDRGGPVLSTGRLLLDVGARGPRAAAALEAAGDEALTDSAALATDLFDGAVAAGASPARLAARRAEAAALNGDLDSALRLADRALSDVDAADRPLAATVAATVLAQRGMLADSAALCRSADTAICAPPGAAVTALIGVGDLAAAERELAAMGPAPTGTPALRHTVGSLVAHGIHHTVTGPALDGLSELVQAARLLGEQAHTTLLPEAPSALAALVAIHLGEPDVAVRVLGRALATQPDRAMGSVRCRLLHGWIALLRGELTAAEATLATVKALPEPLAPRDELYAAGLALGMARRRTDLPALMAAWPRAREAVLAHPVDLYVLLPLGEIAVAAAKLNEGHLLAGHMDQAEAMLDRLGRPPLWSGPLHWYGLHAAIAAESPATAIRHARAMAAMAEGGRCVAALAGAAASWLRVLAGDVDVEAVMTAARDIQSVGLVWDGARLAGQAAIRTTDRKAMAALLSFARALHDGAQSTTPTSQPTDASPATLSNRELEVAALLVEGMTYKQIGERLFISAKTVEHHIARMRHRLGDPARRELLARLRTMVAESGVAKG